MKLDWTKNEFEIYLLLYAAHSNHLEDIQEENFILSKVDSKTYHRIHTEVVVDSDEVNLNKIQHYVSENHFSQQEKEDLIKNIKNVLFADGSVDILEKKVFSILQKIIN